MAVAVAFLLQFSLAMAFTTDKESHVTDDEQSNELMRNRTLHITRINANPANDWWVTQSF